MKTDRRVQVLRRRPEGLVHRVVVALLFGRRDGDHAPGQSQLAHPRELADGFVNVLHVDEGDAAQPIGCGAGGVVGAGREIEEGPAAVVWAASMPEAEISTHHFEVERSDDGFRVLGLPPIAELGEVMVVLADPYSFAAEALLQRLGDVAPGMPVLGGLASAAAAGSASLFRDGDVIDGGAVACSLSGTPLMPCVSQGAAPVGPEMTITAEQQLPIAALVSAAGLLGYRRPPDFAALIDIGSRFPTERH